MAKRPPYSIAADDPDIIFFKEKYPALLDELLKDSYVYLPGKEEGTWNSLEFFTGETFNIYKDHCLAHYDFINSHWSEDAERKIIAFTYTLRDQEFADKDKAIALLSEAMMLTDIYFAQSNLIDTPKCYLPTIHYNLGLDFNSLVEKTFSAWLKFIMHCETAGLFKLAGINSKSSMRKHHSLASQAASLAVIAHHKEMAMAGSGAICFPLVFKMLEQAIKWQQEEREASTKKRQLESPDSFLFKAISRGKNSRQFRSINQELFIKAWLFKFTEHKEEFCSKGYSAQELLNEMSKKFPECKQMPPSTLENLLTNLKKRGYAKQRLINFLN